MKKIEHLIYYPGDDESSRITHAEMKIDELVSAVAELQKIEATKQKQWNELQEATRETEPACDCLCHENGRVGGSISYICNHCIPQQKKHEHEDIASIEPIEET